MASTINQILQWSEHDRQGHKAISNEVKELREDQQISWKDKQVSEALLVQRKSLK